MRIYFDSSALVKRYVNEPGTEQVLEWYGRATVLTTSAIALPEVFSALCRLQRESRISAGHYHLLKRQLLADIEDADLVALTPQVLAKAINCIESNTLRGMDAIHVGSALVLGVDVFVSADLRQTEAAAQSGLNVEVV